jgi:hypothetical protein
VRILAKNPEGAPQSGIRGSLRLRRELDAFYLDGANPLIKELDRTSVIVTAEVKPGDPGRALRRVRDECDYARVKESAAAGKHLEVAAVVRVYRNRKSGRDEVALNERLSTGIHEGRLGPDDVAPRRKGDVSDRSLGVRYLSNNYVPGTDESR